MAVTAAACQVASTAASAVAEVRLTAGRPQALLSACATMEPAKSREEPVSPFVAPAVGALVRLTVEALDAGPSPLQAQPRLSFSLTLHSSVQRSPLSTLPLPSSWLLQLVQVRLGSVQPDPQPFCVLCQLQQLACGQSVPRPATDPRVWMPHVLQPQLRAQPSSTPQPCRQLREPAALTPLPGAPPLRPSHQPPCGPHQQPSPPLLWSVSPLAPRPPLPTA
mmetsp:Transcript_22051/g.51435  ORF Transcript_22051/g.51435 Transcript_22051/m.51435 type:complete len:221 (+) Transcript_22051:123-785(+)